MGWIKALAGATALTLGLLGAARAATIEYTATNLAGSTWRYDYTVINDTLGAPLEQFTIFFELGLYENLAALAGPAGWDVLVIQPDPALPDDGFYDGLAMLGGIAPAGSQGGFAVSFSYLGQGAPGAQAFDVVDRLTLVALETGRTVAAAPPPPPPPPPAQVPLPGTLGLLALGWLLVHNSVRRHIGLASDMAHVPGGRTASAKSPSDLQG